MNQELIQKRWEQFSWIFWLSVVAPFVSFFFPVSFDEWIFDWTLIITKLISILVVLALSGIYNGRLGGSRFVGLWGLIPLVGFFIVWDSIRRSKNKALKNVI